MLLRDNVFGSLEEDAARRDFTLNALYYCSEDFTVYDFVHGMPDLENRQICIIGNPEKRYREDPVRMLRAIRCAAKLGFEIEEQTAAPIPDLAHMLEAIPEARLFDEMLKLINKSIENLPKKCKEIFVLSKKEGYTNIEIAEILNISIKTVESQITIAFKQIKKETAVYNF